MRRSYACFNFIIMHLYYPFMRLLNIERTNIEPHWRLHSIDPNPDIRLYDTTINRCIAWKRYHWTFFPQVSKRWKSTTRCWCWTEGFARLGRRRIPRISTHLSRVLADQRGWRKSSINVTNPSLTLPPLAGRSFASIVERDTSGTTVWEGTKGSIVGLRRKNTPAICATKSLSTDTSCEIMFTLITIKNPKFFLFFFSFFSSSSLFSIHHFVSRIYKRRFSQNLKIL